MSEIVVVKDPVSEWNKLLKKGVVVPLYHLNSLMPNFT